MGETKFQSMKTYSSGT